MKKVYHLVMVVSYLLGVVSLVLAVAIRFVGAVSTALPYSPRGALAFASTLFLCVLASWAANQVETGGSPTAS